MGWGEKKRGVVVLAAPRPWPGRAGAGRPTRSDVTRLPARLPDALAVAELSCGGSTASTLCNKQQPAR